MRISSPHSFIFLPWNLISESLKIESNCKWKNRPNFSFSASGSFSLADFTMWLRIWSRISSVQVLSMDLFKKGIRSIITDLICWSNFSVSKLGWGISDDVSLRTSQTELALATSIWLFRRNLRPPNTGPWYLLPPKLYWRRCWSFCISCYLVKHPFSISHFLFIKSHFVKSLEKYAHTQ